MKKIAIPMANGDLSDRFEEYQYFLIYDLENPLGIKEDIKYPPSHGVEKLPAWFLSCGVSDIIIVIPGEIVSVDVEPAVNIIIQGNSYQYAANPL